MSVPPLSPLPQLQIKTEPIALGRCVMLHAKCAVPPADACCDYCLSSRPTSRGHGMVTIPASRSSESIGGASLAVMPMHVMCLSRHVM